MQAGSPRTTRNSPCPCGSLLRFKQCCGQARSGADGAAPVLLHALRAQLSGRLDEAIRLYEHHLAHAPDEFDALHMRAVALFQMGCIDEAQDAFRDLWARHPQPPEAAWTNLGLLASAVCHLRPDSRAKVAIARHEAWNAKVRDALATAPGPVADGLTVGIAVASYNHANYVAEALDSIRMQTRLPNQLVVIDDGSTDGTIAAIERALANFPSTVALEFIARGNRGAAQTLNEAIARLSTSWIAPLNSDDRFDPHRLQRLEGAARQLQPFGTQFLIGGIDLIGHDGAPLATPLGARARSALVAHSSMLMHHSVGLSLLAANCTVTSGNQFFTRSLWEALGGYRHYRYNHDWDFALRSCKVAEPVVVPDARYAYRVHDSNTIAAAGKAAVDEARSLLADFARPAEAGSENPHAPTIERWGSAFLEVLGGIGELQDLPSHVLYGAPERGVPPALTGGLTAPSLPHARPQISGRAPCPN